MANILREDPAGLRSRYSRERRVHAVAGDALAKSAPWAAEKMPSLYVRSQPNERPLESGFNATVTN